MESNPIKPIEISGSMTLEEWKQFQSLIFPPKHRFTLYAMAIVFFLVLIVAIRPPFPFGPIFLLFLVSGFIYLVIRFRRSTYQTYLRNVGGTTMLFDEEGVRVTSPDSETRFKWSAFSKYKTGADVLLLYVANAQCVVVARSYCVKDDQWERVHQLVRTQVFPESTEFVPVKGKGGIK